MWTALERREGDRDRDRDRDRESFAQAGRPLEAGWKGNREAALRQALQNKVSRRDDSDRERDDSDMKRMPWIGIDRGMWWAVPDKTPKR